MYMDSFVAERKINYTFIDYTRKQPELGKRLKIKKVTFLNKDKPIYKTSEFIQLKVEIETKKTIKDVRFALSIKSIDMEPSGLAEMNRSINIPKSENYEIKLVLNICNFSAGTYKASLFCYEFLNESCLKNDLDGDLEYIIFDVIDDNNNHILWKKEYWGNIRLNALECKTC